MIVIDGVRLNESYLCWHFRREDAYSPWETIGLIFCNSRMYYTRYLDDYRFYEDLFYNEWNNVAPLLKGSFEALNIYRLKYQQVNNVISPVIRYVSEGNPNLDQMSKTYLGNDSFDCFRKLTIMLKLRERYFSCMLQQPDKRKKINRHTLKKAGYL